MRMTFYVLLGMTLGWYCWNALLAWVLALALSYAALVAYELLRGPEQRPALRRAMARLLASGVGCGWHLGLCWRIWPCINRRPVMRLIEYNLGV